MTNTTTTVVEGVYLLHFTKPLGRAKHYIGWSPDIDKRVARHKTGKGAKFTASAVRKERSFCSSEYGKVVTGDWNGC